MNNAIATFLALLFLSSCTAIDCCEELVLNRIHKHLTQDENLLNTSCRTNNSPLHVYIDYSDGMFPALNEASKFFYSVLDIVNEPDTRYYRVGSTSYPQAVTKSQLEQQFDPRKDASFSDTRSELDVALANIVKTNALSLFISDFELVKTGSSSLQRTDDGVLVNTYITLDSWALKDLDTWLSNNGSLEIFASPYVKNDTLTNEIQSQYLYFMLFVPDNNLYCEKTTTLINRIKSSSTSIQHLNYSQNAFRIINNVENSTHEILSPNCYYNKEKQLYEYHQLIHDDLLNYIMLNDTEEDKRILKGVQFSNQTSLSAPNFRIETFDITDIHETYFSEGILNTHIKPTPTPNKFKLVYKDGRLGLKLDKTFTRLSKDRELYQVNVYLKGGKTSLLETDLQLLEWYDINGQFNVSALKNSVKEAVQRMKLPENKLLYTYYIDLIN